MSAGRVRVILADDHTLVRDGIRRILEGEEGFVVVDDAADGNAAVEAVSRTDADVLVLDLTMPGRDGLEVLGVVRRLRPNLRVIVLTMHAGREYVARAMQGGAAGYLLKDSAVQDLVSAVRTVVGGGAYYSPAIQHQMAEFVRDASRTPQGVHGLSERERDVLRLLARGLSSKEIGSALDISTRTVETHRANVARKLGVKSVALLTQVAIREGIVEPSP